MDADSMNYNWKRKSFIQQSSADHLTPNPKPRTPNWQKNINKLLSLASSNSKRKLNKSNFNFCCLSVFRSLCRWHNEQAFVELSTIQHSSKLNTDNIRSMIKRFISQQTEIPVLLRFDLLTSIRKQRSKLLSLNPYDDNFFFLHFVTFTFIRSDIFRGNCSSWHCSGYKFENNVSCNECLLYGYRMITFK